MTPEIIGENCCFLKYFFWMYNKEYSLHIILNSGFLLRQKLGVFLGMN